MRKMYVVTRGDLPKVYAAVQGGHALAEWILDNPEIAKEEWCNGRLIYVKVDNLEKLKELVQLWATSYAYKTYSLFWEPDLKYELTAAAIYTHNDLLESLPLL